MINRPTPKVNEIWSHYKGTKVRIIGLGYHTETNEYLVCYTHDNSIWFRPLTVFMEVVKVSNIPNIWKPRFYREI